VTSFHSDALEALGSARAKRPRRLRGRSAARPRPRDDLEPSDFVYPLFVVAGEDIVGPCVDARRSTSSPSIGSRGGA
jgi:hypothetical protein